MPHVPFDPQGVGWSQLYTAAPEQQQQGFGIAPMPSFNVYQGRPFQRGTGIGSVFRSLFQRFLLPIGKQLGREGLAATQRVLSKVVDEGVPLEAAVKEGARTGMQNLLNRASEHIAKKRKKADKAPVAAAEAIEAQQEGEGPIGGTSAKKRRGRGLAKNINSGEGLVVGRRYRTVLPPPPTTSNFLNAGRAKPTRRRR